jgi:predicted amidohydrolase
MPRIIRIAACQVGATHKSDRREDTLNRLLSLLDNAASQGATLALFPEIAFTTFFPRYILEEKELEKVKPRCIRSPK